MQNGEKLTPHQISEFLKGSEEVSFTAASKAEVYSWVQEVLVAQEFASQNKGDRGAIRAYIEKVTGLSVPQATRLIRQYRETGVVALQPSERLRFARKYTDRDIALLAETDRAHEWLSGPATRCILRREYEQFGKQPYARLAGISTAHLYNLRQSPRYRKAAAKFEPTRPTPVSIGERRRPEPQNRPGYLRVDTVHQGDCDGIKGVYHINAVDTETQWQVVGCVSRISEQFLLPVLEAMLHQFPFRILGFHSDNGSEFINHSVEKLLNSLFIEFSKSRACRSQDNALVEGKNGAIIRKLIGYGHIAGRHAEVVQKFHTAHLNPYLNFHRPCGFATVTVDARGKRRRTYCAENYATPYEKLKSMSDASKYLKPEVRFASLDLLAQTMSDTEAARKMSRAKAAMLSLCKSEQPAPPKCS
jgi:transposase InsO family protein